MWIAETHDGSRTHGLAELLRVAEILIPVLQTVFTHDDLVVRQDTVNEVIADEAVQGVLAVLQVTVVLTGISGINGVVDLLSMCNQIVDVVDAVCLIDSVGLHEGRELEVALLNPLNGVGTFCLTLQREVVGIGRVL